MGASNSQLAQQNWAPHLQLDLKWEQFCGADPFNLGDLMLTTARYCQNGTELLGHPADIKKLEYCLVSENTAVSTFETLRSDEY